MDFCHDSFFTLAGILDFETLKKNQEVPFAQNGIMPTFAIRFRV